MTEQTTITPAAASGSMARLREHVRSVYQGLNRRTGGRLAIVKYAYLGFQRDECTVRAAAIAYRALFSIFPLVLLLFTLSSTLLARPEIRTEVVSFLIRKLQAPGLAADVIQAANQALEKSGAVGILALAGLIWGGSGIFSTVDYALNAAWGVEKQRPFIRRQLLGLGMALAVALLFLLSVAGAAAYRVSGLAAHPWEATWSGRAVAKAAGAMLPTVFGFLMFLVLYIVLPNTRVSLVAAGIGALVADVLWQITNLVYTVYVSHLAQGRYSVIYGPFGAIILFMIWIYLSAVILLIGAELAAAYDIHRDNKPQLPLVSRL